MKKLSEIFNAIGHFGADIGANDKGSTHSYIDTYEKILAPYRGGARVLEIGVAMGDSIKMWNEYFQKSLIIGVDISIVAEKPEAKNENRILFFQADATKEGFMSEFNNFDVVIDDGEHTQQSQIATFNLLKDKMNEGGIYIIEDILNPEVALPYLKALHHNCEVIDLRGVKGRFDDVLVIYRDFK